MKQAKVVKNKDWIIGTKGGLGFSEEWYGIILYHTDFQDDVTCRYEADTQILVFFPQLFWDFNMQHVYYVNLIFFFFL